MADLLWPPGATALPTESEGPYYLIIGAGIAALMNHLTLRSVPKCRRIETLPVLHVGSEDPWTLYEESSLGQWPALLSLPGFNHSPNGTPHNFLSISELADMVKLEWRELAKRCPFFALNGEVREIQRHGDEYRVKIGDGRTLQARYVDICGGPGPARRLSASQIADDDLAVEYESGKPAAGEWCRLVTAERFLQRDCAVADNGSVLVAGGGPTGAWCVERAEKQGCSVVWLSRDSLDNALLPTRRNDGLVDGVIARSWKDGVYTIDHEVFPSRQTTTFVEGYEIGAVSLVDGRIKIRYDRDEKNSSPRCVSGRHDRLEIERVTSTFDQVVTAFGQCNGQDEEGSWANITRSVFPPNTVTRPHLLRDAQNRAVAVQSDDGRLRFLGASALAHPEMVEEIRDPLSTTHFYFQTLPEQARVQTGFAMAGVTIAEANGWFVQGKPHRNLNTVSLHELGKLLDPALFPEIAAAWIKSRSTRIHPWTFAEFEKLVKSTTDSH